jgi:hypothetical protein
MRAHIAGVLALTSAACADTVDLSYTSQNYGRAIHVTLGQQQYDSFAGRLYFNATGLAGHSGSTRITTFCVDLLQTQSTASNPYTTSSVATLSGNTGLTNLGYAKQQAIYDIFQAAAGREYTLGLDYATAFQVAVWEVVYDYNPNLPGYGLNVATGTFRATAPGQSSLSASITQKVLFLLGSVGAHAGAGHIGGFRSLAFQDQVTDMDMMSPATVPLPRGVVLGLTGLGLMAAGKRRRMIGH